MGQDDDTLKTLTEEYKDDSREKETEAMKKKKGQILAGMLSMVSYDAVQHLKCTKRKIDKIIAYGIMARTDKANFFEMILDLKGHSTIIYELPQMSTRDAFNYGLQQL